MANSPGQGGYYNPGGSGYDPYGYLGQMMGKDYFNSLPGTNSTSTQAGFASKPYNPGGNAMADPYSKDRWYQDQPYQSAQAAPPWQSATPEASMPTGTNSAANLPPGASPDNPYSMGTTGAGNAVGVGVGGNPNPNDFGSLYRGLPDNFSQNWLYNLMGSGLNPMSGTPGSSLASSMMGRALGGYIAQRIMGQGNGRDTTGYIQQAMSNPGSLMGGQNFGGANNLLASAFRAMQGQHPESVSPQLMGYFEQLDRNPQDLYNYVTAQMPMDYGSSALAQSLPTLLRVMESQGGAGGPYSGIQAALKLLGISV